MTRKPRARSSLGSGVLIAVDVGNTSVALGAFRGRRLVKTGRFTTDPAMSRRSLSRRLGAFWPRRAPGAIYASVVPKLDRRLEAALRARFGCRPARVDPGSDLGVKLRVRAPREVGADRIVNALAAVELYGAPAVVVDFGTATTFDCVSEKGDYLGGAILPGPVMTAQALAEKTAKLPLIVPRRPRRIVGKDTAECIQGGLYYGYLGGIREILERTVAEMGIGGRKKAVIIATGGQCGLFRSDLPRGIRFAPDLALQGLRLAFEKINDSRRRMS